MDAVPVKYQSLIEEAIKLIPYTECEWDHCCDELDEEGQCDGSYQDHRANCYKFNCAIDYCCLEDRDGDDRMFLRITDFTKYVLEHYKGDWERFAKDIRDAMTDFKIQNYTSPTTPPHDYLF